jgi:hypothetical protein
LIPETMTFADFVNIASDAGPLIALAIIAWVMRGWMDARVRGKLATSNNSQELIRAVLESDQQSRRLAPLRWGTVLIGLAIALAVIDVVGWQQPRPAAFAVLLGMTGLANLAAFVLIDRIGGRRDR